MGETHYNIYFILSLDWARLPLYYSEKLVLGLVYPLNIIPYFTPHVPISFITIMANSRNNNNNNAD